MGLLKINNEEKTLDSLKKLTELFNDFSLTENEFDKDLSSHLEHNKTIEGFSFYKHNNLN